MIEIINAPRGIHHMNLSQRKRFQSGRYIEFLGGAGDLLNRCHQCDWYTSIVNLRSSESVSVGYMVHNPAGLDLFRWIPTRGRVMVMNLGFSAAWGDPSWRAERGLPKEAPFHPYDIRRIDYYPSKDDVALLDELYRIGPYVAFCMSAGTPERNIPMCEREKAADTAIALGFKVVQIGGNYRRNSSVDVFPSRDEVSLHDRPGVVNMIDKLSFAGSIKAIERAACVFTAHTALCLASWYVRQPTFLLYNDFVRRQYVPLGPVGYMFGMSRPGNDHMEFLEYTNDRFADFLKGAK